MSEVEVVFLFGCVLGFLWCDTGMAGPDPEPGANGSRGLWRTATRFTACPEHKRGSRVTFCGERVLRQLLDPGIRRGARGAQGFKIALRTL